MNEQKQVILVKFRNLSDVSEYMNKFNVENTIISLTHITYNEWDLLFWDYQTMEMIDFAIQQKLKYYENH
jgi:hypothetical protein